MKEKLIESAQDQLFRQARSINVWRDIPLPDGILKSLYDLMKMGPTSANCSPARFVLITSQQAKERLRPHLMEGNVEKVMQAPATAIIGYDMAFAERMDKLFPHNLDAKNWFADPDVAYQTAFRNGTLQGAYFMMAARSLGLDCGPMSGFDNGAVDQEFFADTQIKSNFLCSVGYGSDENIFPRSPRLDFEEAVEIL